MKTGALNLVMLIVFAAGILSPVCQMTGGAFAALCGSENLVRTASVPAELKPFLAVNPDNIDYPETPPAPQASMECQFCFAKADDLAIEVYRDLHVVPLSAGYTVVSSGIIAPRGLDRTAHYARGPPETFV